MLNLNYNKEQLLIFGGFSMNFLIKFKYDLSNEILIAERLSQSFEKRSFLCSFF